MTSLDDFDFKDISLLATDPVEAAKRGMSGIVRRSVIDAFYEDRVSTRSLKRNRSVQVKVRNDIRSMLNKNEDILAYAVHGSTNGVVIKVEFVPHMWLRDKGYYTQRSLVSTTYIRYGDLNKRMS